MYSELLYSGCLWAVNLHVAVIERWPCCIIHRPLYTYIQVTSVGGCSSEVAALLRDRCTGVSLHSFLPLSSFFQHPLRAVFLTSFLSPCCVCCSPASESELATIQRDREAIPLDHAPPHHTWPSSFQPSFLCSPGHPNMDRRDQSLIWQR